MSQYANYLCTCICVGCLASTRRMHRFKGCGHYVVGEVIMELSLSMGAPISSARPIVATQVEGPYHYPCSLCVLLKSLSMGKKKDLSDVQKTKIMLLRQETKLTLLQIAERVGCCRSSVIRVLDAERKYGNSPTSRRMNAGRKRKTTARDDRYIVQRVMNNRKITINALKNEVQDRGIHVSTKTLKRRLSEHNIRPRKPRTKPRLTPAMVKKRLSWARQHKNWTAEDWEKVSN